MPETPLYVDLDGTLIATDLLHESFLSAVKRSPWIALQCVPWLAAGRHRLKEELACRATIDVASLPYREDVLAFLREERARGRRIVLATASWGSLAEAVAKHLGLFDAVIATSSEGNLKGVAKAERLQAASGAAGFDYLGDSHADLPVWGAAGRAYVVDGTGRFAASLPASVSVERVFQDQGRAPRWRTALRALRPHQWAKNLLVFIPALAAHRFAEPAVVMQAAQAFVAFSLVASSAYLLNDLLDLDADRAHPRKRSRPLASGALSIPAGALLCAASLALGIAVAWPLHPAFGGTLAIYLALTVAYSFALKRFAILDVIALAGLYVIRILAGGLAVGAPVSSWLLAFALFLFFSLALVKRHAELVSMAHEGASRAPGRGYAAVDAPVVMALGIASAMVGALVLALYINGDTVRVLYGRPEALWGLVPLMLYWIARVWMLSARGQMHDDPVLFAAGDANSYFVAAIGCAILWLAT
jgi:4-hydroxybenzoate polyprenyltransferase/phosphoserine phosphatase